MLFLLFALVAELPIFFLLIIYLLSYDPSPRGQPHNLVTKQHTFDLEQLKAVIRYKGHTAPLMGSDGFPVVASPHFYGSSYLSVPLWPGGRRRRQKTCRMGIGGTWKTICTMGAWGTWPGGRCTCRLGTSGTWPGESGGPGGRVGQQPGRLCRPGTGSSWPKWFRQRYR